ncbi:hypothetical protein D7235_10915 [Legionella pneumophila]|nr:hypothetical protein D7235_10915 [Legionella pneumophila]RYB42975.1 hypothetical protein D7237_12960 [Legionella pneumophila]RYB72954.1 hypothetical protein D7286_11070 [Legionella pneumophila]RYB74178.1 hypothetical protein D7285_10630 [Legionella pneumophila]RYW44998.1 hypothetical protein D7244_09165 [Legionella pneumophila]
MKPFACFYLPSQLMHAELSYNIPPDSKLPLLYDPWSGLIRLEKSMRPLKACSCQPMAKHQSCSLCYINECP